MDPASSPPSSPTARWAAARREALDALDPHALHPLTADVHDLLYEMDPEPELAGLHTLVALLERHRDYPARGRIVAAVGAWLELPAPSLRDVLQATGPIPPDTPLVEVVGQRLGRAAEEREVLLARVRLVEDERDRLGAVANGTAVVGAIVAIVALLGWLAALGAWELSWIDPPAPPRWDAPEDGAERLPSGQ